MHRRLFDFMCACLVCAVCGLASPALAEDAVTAYVGVFIHDVTEFDVKNGTFEVDAEVWARWRGELDATQIRLVNAGRVERVLLSEQRDGDWRATRWRVRGTMRGEFEVRRFPVDIQRPELLIELDTRHGVLAPDMASSGMAGHFSLTDWYYDDELRARAYAHEYASDLGSLVNEARPTSVGRVAFSLELRRPTSPVAIKLFLPVGIILLVVFVSMFLPASLIRTRSSIAVTALLSCFAFQFTVNRSLPAVTYLTLADQLFLIAYLMSALALMESVLSYKLEERGQDELAGLIDIGTRVGAPLLCAMLVWWAMPEPEPAPAVTPAAAPELERAPSARDVVRLGTTRLPSVSAPLTTMVWSTGITERECVPLYVEHVAGVDTPAVELLADGALEVTWTIRRGATWSDGIELTSRDIALALELAPPPSLEEVRTLGLRTVVARYTSRVAEALDCPDAYPSHAVADVIASGGAKALAAHRKTHIIPTLGPYEVIEFEPNRRVVARANPHFIGAAPSIERVEITRYDGRDEMFADYMSGELDIIYPNNLPPEMMARAAERKPDHVHMEPGSNLIFLVPDMSVKALDDLPTRAALLQAIDRERIVSTVYPEGGRVAHSPIPGADSSDMARHPRDIVAAREALARAGLTTIELTHASAPVDTRIAGMIAQDLREAGLEVTLTPVESSFRTRRAGGWGGLLLSLTRGSRGRDPRAYFNVPYDGRYAEDVRHSGYTDDVAELVRLEAHALYPERRRQLEERIEETYSRLLPTLPVVFVNERVLADPSLEGWRTAPGEVFMYRADRWRFEEPPAE